MGSAAEFGRITSATRLLSTTKRLSSPNMALRPEVSWSVISKVSLFTEHFRGDATKHTLTLSSSCFPTEVVGIRHGFTRLPGPEVTSPPQVLPSTTFDAFVSAQRSWTRHPLQTLDPKFSYPTIHHHMYTSTSPLALSDGLVQFSQGTFGWVLATTQPPHQLLHFSGPAFGASMDSYRAEEYGLLSIATLLNLMSKFFQSRFYPLQSGMTISQSCKPSTPSLLESVHYSQMMPFDLVGTLCKQHVGPFKLILRSLCNM
jgi:hypothetical protein